MRLGRYLIPQAGYPVGRHIPSGNDNVGFVTFGATMLPWRRSHLPYFSSLKNLAGRHGQRGRLRGPSGGGAAYRCARQEEKKMCLRFFSKVGAHPLISLFLAAEKLTLGGGITSKLATG